MGEVMRDTDDLPNVVTSAVHDRMPVILDRESYDLWLDPGMTNVQVISELLWSAHSDWYAPS